MAAADIRGLTSHEMRHTATSSAVSQGASVRTAIDLSNHCSTRSSLESRASHTQHRSSQTLSQMHQTTLPRGIHHVADPNDPPPWTGVTEDDGGAAAVESAVAAGAARTSRGAAITVAARVLTIFLDILLPYNERYDVRVVGRAAELPDWGCEGVTCRIDCATRDSLLGEVHDASR